MGLTKYIICRLDINTKSMIITTHLHYITLYYEVECTGIVYRGVARFVFMSRLLSMLLCNKF